jgi:hypothetical protein
MLVGARNLPANRGMTLAYGRPNLGIGHRPPRPDALAGVRQDGLNGTSCGRGPVIRAAVVLAVGYVLGAKAGRRRYEQIAGTYRAVAGSPKTKAVIDAGRRRLADRMSPDPALVKLTEIDAETSVLHPEVRQVRADER